MNEIQGINNVLEVHICASCMLHMDVQKTTTTGAAQLMDQPAVLQHFLLDLTGKWPSDPPSNCHLNVCADVLKDILELSCVCVCVCAYVHTRIELCMCVCRCAKSDN